jgi:hypothetical protein
MLPSWPVDEGKQFMGCCRSVTLPNEATSHEVPGNPSTGDAVGQGPMLLLDTEEATYATEPK